MFKNIGKLVLLLGFAVAFAFSGHQASLQRVHGCSIISGQCVSVSCTGFCSDVNGCSCVL
jgi:hypothetical protein